jgi:tRNA pseudouridine38-40 synthase
VESQRFKLTIAYRGTAYHGWQTQGVPPNWRGALPTDGTGLPSVQETLKLAMQHVLNHPVTVVGSSRTDAGVHAKGQVAHFDSFRKQIPLSGLRRAINHQLPDDILVRDIAPVDRSFDAIASTRSKRYQYAVWNHVDRPLFAADLWFHRWQPMDIDAMCEAAKHLEGEHDFASFCKPGHGRETTIRTVHAVDISRVGPRVVLAFEGSGFLWNQVRVMAGTLIDVGEGIYKPEQIPEMLAAKDRRRAGKTAPAQGLYLQWIRFNEPGPAAGANDEFARIAD